MSWQKGEEEKAIGAGSLTAKILCERHNRSLSPLDVTTERLFRTFRTIDGAYKPGAVEPRDRYFLFNGHDVERAMLKALCGGLVSGNMKLSGETLKDWVPPERWLDILAGRTKQLPGCGMYLSAKEVLHSADFFGMASLTNVDSGEIMGGEVFIAGFHFLVPMAKPNMAADLMQKAYFRPGSFTIAGLVPASPKFKIEFYWGDGESHQDLGLTRVGNYHGDHPVWIKGNRKEEAK